ncbi:hypothetical protein YC2023_124556 [Brassica napus]
MDSTFINTNPYSRFVSSIHLLSWSSSRVGIVKYLGEISQLILQITMKNFAVVRTHNKARAWGILIT